MNRILLTAALLALAPCANAAVLDSAKNGFTVENSVTVAAAPDKAWDALINHVDEWWPKDHSWFGKDGKFSIEPRAGGCFCEKAGERQALHMTVGYAEPGKLLRMLGGLGPLAGMGLSGTMDWTLAPDGHGGTKITLHYVAGGYTTTDMTTFAPVVDRVQAQQLGGLGKFLTQKK